MNIKIALLILILIVIINIFILVRLRIRIKKLINLNNKLEFTEFKLRRKRR